MEIEIENTGGDIAREKLDRLFDRFYQLDESSAHTQAGTGIGLALVKEIVELHGGTARATSSNGKVKFTVVLPLSAVEEISPHSFPDPVKEVQTSDVIEQGEDNPTESERLKLLVVEDYPDLRKFISDGLSDTYDVTEAVDGMDGLQKAGEITPDLIISDIMMPNMDGYELCRRLKTEEHTNHIPVILLTAKATRENKIEGLEIGADDYLTKPFDAEELKVRVKNLIQIREQLQLKFQQEVWLRPKEIKVSSVQQKFLEDIKAIIETNLSDETFSVEVLEAEIGMSRSQIHRKLKALTDQPATNFIHNYRLHRGADLLAQKSGSISEIAYQVGFNSQTYFSSSFQELFGRSPSEYVENPTGPS